MQIWSASPTPFHDDGTLDTASIEKVVQRHIHLGVRGLLIGGTSGEGPFMPIEQLTALIRVIRAVAERQLVLAVQVTDTSAARVIRNMDHLLEAGADHLVIAPPWLVGPFCNSDYIRRYFLEPLERHPAPMGLYVRQPLPTTDMDLAMWTELAGHPHVTLVKDSSGDDAYRDALSEVARQRGDLTLLTGNEFNVMEAAAAGYDGGLLGTGILNATFIRHGFDALQRGDREAADAWQVRSNRFLHDLFREDISSWMSGLKYALTRLGIFSSTFTHLSYPLDDADRDRIDAALEREAEYLACSTVPSSTHRSLRPSGEPDTAQKS